MGESPDRPCRAPGLIDDPREASPLGTRARRFGLDPADLRFYLPRDEARGARSRSTPLEGAASRPPRMRGTKLP
jgi:hypothetical protein